MNTKGNLDFTQILRLLVQASGDISINSPGGRIQGKLRHILTLLPTTPTKSPKEWEMS